MDVNIEGYLHKRFHFDNHKKYHKYFNEWFINLTENQLYYFKKDFEKEQK